MVMAAARTNERLPWGGGKGRDDGPLLLCHISRFNQNNAGVCYTAARYEITHSGQGAVRSNPTECDV